MRVDDKKYAKFEYNDGYSGDHTKNPFQRGDVVFRATDESGDDCPEIGVVLQVHDEYELRTDMFGNESIDYVRLATADEVLIYRTELALEMGLVVTK
jgi:hypothetical protein